MTKDKLPKKQKLVGVHFRLEESILNKVESLIGVKGANRTEVLRNIAREYFLKKE